MDFDRYYTPVPIAEEMLAKASIQDVKSCVDSTCGTGNLLHAASNVYQDICCFGLDKDKTAIELLKRRRPEWTLSVGDLLRRISYARTNTVNSALGVDVLLMNPPFSIGDNKFVRVMFEGWEVKASVAMAHILTSFELFRPKKGAVIIVPESVLYSEVDEVARELLLARYELSVLEELEIATFKGARVHSTVVSFTPKSLLSQLSAVQSSSVYVALKGVLIRGGLPVYQSVDEVGGLPYVHSTDLKSLGTNLGSSELRRVRRCSRGVAKGWLLLLPRVGMPKEEYFKTFCFSDDIQFSDCVIGIGFHDRDSVEEVRSRILSNWDSLKDLYRGTGARYVTKGRLKKWLQLVCGVST